MVKVKVVSMCELVFDCISEIMGGKIVVVIRV